MTLRIPHFWLLALSLLILSGTGRLGNWEESCLAADQKPSQQPASASGAAATLPEIPSALRQEETIAVTLKQQLLEAEQKQKEAAERLADAQQRQLDLEAEIPVLTRLLTEAEDRLKKEQAEAAAAKKRNDAAVQKKEKEQVLKESARLLAEATAKVDKTEAEIKTLRLRSDAAAKDKGLSAKSISEAMQQEQASAKSVEARRTAWTQQEQKIVQMQKDAGLWVSFSQEIAPLLASRCLACHNGKKPEGGLNLESYSALSAGGESGAVLDETDRPASLLLTLTQDGSMPQNADPLSPEELALLGRWVVTGGRLDQGVKAGAELIQIMPRTPQPNPPASYRRALPVTALAFSPDGSLLASSGYHEVQLWEIKTRTLVRRVSNVAERVYQLDFSPDGKKIAVAAGTPGRLGEIKVFQVSDGQLSADLLITSEVQLSVAFSPDGSRLAAGGEDRKLRVFDLKTNQPVVEVEPHLDWLTGVAWSPDGTLLVTCSLDKTARILRSDSGESVVAFNGHSDTVAAVAFLPEGKQVVSGGADRVLRIWSVNDAAEVRKISGFGAEISGLALLPDQKIMTTSLDRQGRIHQTADGKQVLTLGSQSDPLYAVAVHSQSSLIATGSQGGEILLSHLNTGKPVARWIAIPKASPPAQAAISAEDATSSKPGP